MPSPNTHSPTKVRVQIHAFDLVGRVVESDLRSRCRASPGARTTRSVYRALLAVAHGQMRTARLRAFLSARMAARMCHKAVNARDV